MFKQIDKSQFLIRILQGLSTFLARKRGLPVVAGIVCLVVAFALQLFNVSAQSRGIELAHIIFHYVGLLSAFIGILLAEPLGK